MTQHTIPITLPDGSVEPIDADTIVNSTTALLESMRRPPILHKIQMIPVQVDLERDCAQIKGGQVYLKHPARARLAAAAGVRQVGPPRVWSEGEGTDRRTFAQVSLNRPGFFDQPVTQVADGLLSEQPSHLREHFTAKLITRAYKRCLTVILGESFLYDPAFLRARNGLFVFACITEDVNDPDVRQVALERMRGAQTALYPQHTAIASPPPMVALPMPDHDPEFDVEGGDAEGTPWATDASGDDAAMATGPSSLPTWAKSFARDRLTGEINYESLPIEKVERLVRDNVRTSYPMDTDPAGVVAAAKAKEWVRAARALVEWEVGQ